MLCCEPHIFWSEWRVVAFLLRCRLASRQSHGEVTPLGAEEEATGLRPCCIFSVDISFPVHVSVPPRALFPTRLVPRAPRLADGTPRKRCHWCSSGDWWFSLRWTQDGYVSLWTVPCAVVTTTLGKYGRDVGGVVADSRRGGSPLRKCVS